MAARVAVGSEAVPHGGNTTIADRYLPRVQGRSPVNGSMRLNGFMTVVAMVCVAGAVGGEVMSMHLVSDGGTFPLIPHAPPGSHGQQDLVRGEFATDDMPALLSLALTPPPGAPDLSPNPGGPSTHPGSGGPGSGFGSFGGGSFMPAGPGFATADTGPGPDVHGPDLPDTGGLASPDVAQFSEAGAGPPSFGSGGGGGGSILGSSSPAVVSSPPPSAIPEPGAWWLLLLGLGGAGAALRHQRRSGPVLEGPGSKVRLGR
jgi:hypothetical protein